MATSAQLKREILAGQWDEALCTLYGTEPAVLARQRQRYAAALEQFELYYGPGRQVHVYSAPGRVELGGNHTDHQHGYGLAAAVTLDLVAVASPSDDGFIRVKSRGFNKLDVIDLSEAEPQQGESTHSASLIRGIAEGFRAQGKTVGGFDAYTASDVLRGSGLSSSAAFEMGMAAILNGEYGCGLTAPELAKICQYAENTYFGKPSGLLDQLTSAVGGVIFADFADPKKPRIEKIHTAGLLPADMTLCVTDTRGSHSELTGEFAAIWHEMGIVLFCVRSTILRRMPAHWPSGMPWSAGISTLSCSSFWKVDTPLLPCARTFTALRTYGIRDSRWRLPSVRLCLRGRGEPGGCRAAALQGPFRRLCPVC